MKAKYLDFLFCTLVAMLAAQFYFIWVVTRGTMYLHYIAYFQEERPFVYRLLVPAIARSLAWITNIDVTYCMMFVFILSAVGLFYSFKYLYATFRHDERGGLFAFVGCGIDFLMMIFEPKVYDPATGMFFALAFALLARGKFRLYYLLFPIATLNRETTFLLIPFFAVYFFSQLPGRAYILGLAYQGIAYVTIKALVMLAFVHTPGSAFWFRPIGVFDGYLAKPFGALALVGTFALALWLVWRGWKDKPIFLRTAFVMIFPALLILHLLMGYAFELRVLVEVAPFVLLLATWPYTVGSATRQIQPSLAIGDKGATIYDSFSVLHVKQNKPTDRE